MIRAYRRTVRLLGVPAKHQGTHDSLCAYYAAAMLLCALRPEFEGAFDSPSVDMDPIFSNIGHAAGTLHARVCRWLAAGERLSAITQALNRACAGEYAQTRFLLERATRSVATRKKIERQIDQGLPTVLAWDGREMGHHTVTVIGYEHYGRSRAWLRVHDPGMIQHLVEWDQIVRLADQPFQLITCVAHSGVRPQRVQVFRTREGALIDGTTQIASWDQATASYIPVNMGATA